MWIFFNLTMKQETEFKLTILWNQFLDFSDNLKGIKTTLRKHSRKKSDLIVIWQLIIKSVSENFRCLTDLLFRQYNIVNICILKVRRCILTNLHFSIFFLLIRNCLSLQNFWIKTFLSKICHFWAYLVYLIFSDQLFSPCQSSFEKTLKNAP